MGASASIPPDPGIERFRAAWNFVRRHKLRFVESPRMLSAVIAVLQFVLHCLVSCLHWGQRSLAAARLVNRRSRARVWRLTGGPWGFGTAGWRPTTDPGWLTHCMTRLFRACSRMPALAECRVPTRQGLQRPMRAAERPLGLRDFSAAAPPRAAGTPLCRRQR